MCALQNGVHLYSNQGEQSRQLEVALENRKIDNWLFFYIAGSGIPECFHGCLIDTYFDVDYEYKC